MRESKRRKDEGEKEKKRKETGEVAREEEMMES